MIEVITYIYLGGCGVVAIAFAIMIRMLDRSDPSPDRWLYSMFWRIAPSYVLLWPWRCVIFPIWKCPELRNEL